MVDRRGPRRCPPPRARLRLVGHRPQPGPGRALHPGARTMNLDVTLGSAACPGPTSGARSPSRWRSSLRPSSSSCCSSCSQARCPRPTATSSEPRPKAPERRRCASSPATPPRTLDPPLRRNLRHGRCPMRRPHQRPSTPSDFRARRNRHRHRHAAEASMADVTLLGVPGTRTFTRARRRGHRHLPEATGHERSWRDERGSITAFVASSPSHS